MLLEVWIIAKLTRSQEQKEQQQRPRHRRQDESGRRRRGPATAGRERTDAEEASSGESARDRAGRSWLARNRARGWDRVVPRTTVSIRHHTRTLSLLLSHTHKCTHRDSLLFKPPVSTICGRQWRRTAFALCSRFFYRRAELANFLCVLLSHSLWRSVVVFLGFQMRMRIFFSLSCVALVFCNKVS